MLLGEKDSVTFVHLSPLDACFELLALWWKSNFERVRIFGATNVLDNLNGCMAKLSRTFLEDLRPGEHKFVTQSTIKFNNTVDPSQMAHLTVKRPDLTLAKLGSDGKRVPLALEIRKKWASDSVY